MRAISDEDQWALVKSYGKILVVIENIRSHCLKYIGIGCSLLLIKCSPVISPAHSRVSQVTSTNNLITFADLLLSINSTIWRDAEIEYSRETIHHLPTLYDNSDHFKVVRNAITVFLWQPLFVLSASSRLSLPITWTWETFMQPIFPSTVHLRPLPCSTP